MSIEGPSDNQQQLTREKEPSSLAGCCISNIQRRDYTLKLVGFGCVAFEGHNAHWISEMGEYDTQIISTREIFFNI